MRTFSAALCFVVLLLAGCSVVVTPGRSSLGSAGMNGQARTVYLNRSLQLRAYPGTTLLELRDEGRHTRAVFTTPADLQRVYGYLHDQLAASGWQRTGYHSKGPATKLEASYRRNGETLTLRLDLLGKSGRMKLEIS